jgi:hypothetical protein
MHTIQNLNVVKMSRNIQQMRETDKGISNLPYIII